MRRKYGAVNYHKVELKEQAKRDSSAERAEKERTEPIVVLNHRRVRRVTSSQCVVSFG